MTGRDLIERLHGRWRLRHRLRMVIDGAATALPVASLALFVVPPSPARPWIVAVTAAVTAVVVARRFVPRSPTPAEIARHLDRVVPALEDSTELLLVEPSDRADLASRQRRRIDTRIRSLDPGQFPPRSYVSDSWLRLAGGMLLAVGIGIVFIRASGLHGFFELRPGQAPAETAAASPTTPIPTLEIVIDPPSYTGRPGRRETKLELEVESGATVRWRLLGPVEAATLEYADGEVLPMTAIDGGAEVALTATETRLYRLRSTVRGTEEVSPLARLAVIPDRPPVVTVVEPTTRVTNVDLGAQSAPLQLEIQDDYGLGRARMIVTLARGSGEQVAFRERRRPIQLPSRGPNATLDLTLDPAELGLNEPGAELYVAIEVEDNRPPTPNVGRSATQILRVPAERVVRAELDAGIPIVLPPEYFRSQRQIIIDTEALIEDLPTIASDELAYRAESLGFDQRALRMRYGALLGEEFVDGQAADADTEAEGGDHDHDHEAEAEVTVEDDDSPFAGLSADLFHAHDSAEIATFFTSETRDQLKAVLGQMWDAEGRLRVHDPRAALPFEYRALELLKDLQQRSRVYVERVGFDTPPLDVDALRLTGELDDIRDLRARSSETQPDLVAGSARRLLDALAATSGTLEADDVARVRGPIAELALGDAGLVRALDGLDHLAAGRRPPDPDTRRALERALWRLGPTPTPAPTTDSQPSSGDPLAEAFAARLAGSRP